MSDRILSRSALVLGVLASLAAAPALAAQSELVVHDEGNSGPALVQAEQQHVAAVKAAAAPHQELVVRDEGQSAPELVIH